MIYKYLKYNIYNNSYLILNKSITKRDLIKISKYNFLNLDGTIIIDELNNISLYNNKGNIINFDANSFIVLMNYLNLNELKNINNYNINFNNKYNYLEFDIPNIIINSNNNSIINLNDKHLLIYKKDLKKNKLLKEAKVLSKKYKSNIGFFNDIKKIQLLTYKYQDGFKKFDSNNNLALATYLYNIQDKNIIHIINPIGKVKIMIHDNKIRYYGKSKKILEGELFI